MLREWTLCFLGTDESWYFCNWEDYTENIMIEGMSLVNLGFLFKL